MLMGGGTSIMPRIAPTLYEFVPAEDYLRVTEAALRVFHDSDELRRSSMKARVKFLIDRIGIDEYRKLVEEQLAEDWAQRSFDPTGLLFIDDEQADAPSLDGDFARRLRRRIRTLARRPTSSRRSRPDTTPPPSSCRSAT